MKHCVLRKKNNQGKLLSELKLRAHFNFIFEKEKVKLMHKK